MSLLKTSVGHTLPGHLNKQIAGRTEVLDLKFSYNLKLMDTGLGVRFSRFHELRVP